MNLHQLHKELYTKLESIDLPAAHTRISSVQNWASFVTQSDKITTDTRIAWVWDALRVLFDSENPNSNAYFAWRIFEKHAFSSPLLQYAAMLMVNQTIPAEHTNIRNLFVGHVFFTSQNWPLFARVGYPNEQPHWKQHLQHTHNHIKDAFFPMLAHLLEHTTSPHRAFLHELLCTHSGDWTTTHLSMLEDPTLSFAAAEQAIRILHTDERHHATLRSHFQTYATQKARLRRLALKGYTYLKDTEALRAMINRERSAKLRTELQEAIDQCNAPERIHIADQIGVYTLGAPIDPHQGLSELRTLLHEPPSQALWYRICNLLERLRIAESSDIAIQYAQHTLQTWDPDLRICPHHWRDIPTLRTLAPTHTPDHHPFLPISTLAHPNQTQHIKNTLSAVQGKARVRTLKHTDTQAFARCVQHAWDWCAEHDINPKHTRVRLDGRATSMSQAQTWIELRHGFAVEFGRNAFDVFSARTSPTWTHRGLRVLHAKIPRGHPARDKIALSKRALYYAIPIPDDFKLR